MIPIRVKLVCSKSREEDIRKELIEHGIEINENADLILFEKSSINENMILGKSEETIKIVQREKIQYFESYGKEVFFNVDDKRYRIDKKLYQIEERLLPYGFMRVNKSAVVNIMKIKEIIPWIGSKYKLLMDNGEEIEVTRTYYNSFREILGI